MSNTPRTKHGAEFLDVDGDAIRISTENDPDAFSIRAGNTYREFANAQAPAVALAILKAAGVREATLAAADSLQCALIYLEEHEGIRRNQEAQAVLTHRRDAIAAEHGLGAFTATAGPGQSLINALIALQDELAEAKK